MNAQDEFDEGTWKGALLILVIVVALVVFYMISGSSAPAVEFELVGCKRIDKSKGVSDGGIRCKAYIQPGASDKQIRMVSRRINKRVLFEHDDPITLILFYGSRDRLDKKRAQHLVRVLHQGKRYKIMRNPDQE